LEENTNEYCRSCGALLHGKFCSECGEKRFDKKDLTFKKIIVQFIDGLTHFDSKIILGIKLLVTRPGLLAKEYCSGVRVRYAKPLQLFFVINVVFFLLLSVAQINTFTTPLSVQMNNLEYSKFASSMIEHKLEKESVSPEEYNKRLQEYSQKFNAKVSLFSKSLIIIIAPLFALVLQLIFVNRKRLYTENFIFALNFLSWLLLLFITVQLIILPLKFLFKGPDIISNNIFSPLFFISIGVYCFYASLRFYNEKKWIAFVKCLVIPYLFFWVLTAYRFILFLITFYST
jgi:hypothetical protein